MAVMLLLAVSVVLVPTGAVPAQAATSRPTPTAFPTVNGKVLAMTIDAGQLAIGGHYLEVEKPNGGKSAASNLAFIELANPNNVHTFRVTGGLVWALCSTGDIVYFGGTFTAVNGVARATMAAINVKTMRLTSWHPAKLGGIRGCGGYGGKIVFAHSGGFDLYTSAGAHPWHLGVIGGGGRTALFAKGSVYLGGLFDATPQADIHGLVKVNPLNGVVDKRFNVGYRDNTHVGAKGTFDGDCILSLSAGPDGLVVGSGGAHRNGIWNVSYATGGYATGKKWGASRGRITSGDAQAVLWTGTSYMDGQHRNHIDLASEVQGQKRFLNNFSATGKITTWDLGLWGHQANDGDNSGVQSMRAYQGKLIIAGSFLGWGNYNCCGSGSDWEGNNGPHPRRGLIVVPLP